MFWDRSWFISLLSKQDDSPPMSSPPSTISPHTELTAYKAPDHVLGPAHTEVRNGDKTILMKLTELMGGGSSHSLVAQ